MNISVEKLLAKIGEELKQVKPENLQEKVYSIKILCELILDEQQTKSEMPLHKISQQTVHANQTNKVGIDDEANGDSLLDF